MAATAYLYQALPEDMILQVASCNSAKEIWEALQTRHIGVDRVQKARLQTLKTEFEMLKMKEDDNIDKFTAKLNTIEQFTDLEETTLDEAIGRLKAFEERVNIFNGNPNDNQDKLLFSNHDNNSSHEKGFKYGGQKSLVCGDLCGPISPETESGKKYMFSLIDDCTRYMWVYFLKSKDEALETFKEFKLKVKKEVGKKLKSFRTDRGGEFTSKEFTRYCKENGILRQLTAPYSPQQNGIVERRNRVSTKALKDSTPYEALKDRKPNMRYLRVFGCKAYAKVTKPHLKKLDDRSKELVYLKTQPRSKACRLFDHVTKDMFVSRDVKFKEDEGWDWKGYLDNINPSKPEWRDFIISENQTSSSRIIDEVSTQDSEINNENSTPSPIQNNAHDDISDDDEIEQPIDNPSTPPPYTYEPDSEDSTEHTSSIASSSRPLDHTPVRGYKNYLKSIIEHQKCKIEVMRIEIDSINKNKTWKLATLPDNQKAIGLKWVFKTKRDRNGNIIKHKARLVAKGYVQEHGIDYDEVFALVARIETIRLILALSAYHGWEVHHFKEDLQKFKSQMEERFKMSDLSLLAYYLGIKVTQTEDGISIKQTGYANKILKEARMKQPTVALSSCESEFMAATATTCQALWLQRLLNALTSWKEEKVTIRVDNKSAIALMKNLVFHGRSKHIDVHYHFIIECVEKNQIEVEHISGDLQRTDILTKALARIKFTEMRELLGVKELKK
nr:zinc finger, CCHC-type [Tanacetum cinerariifolium]